MEEKFMDATKNRPEGERAINAPSLCIDLEAFTEQIQDEKQWKERDRNAIVVFKSDKLRLILISLHKDAEMTTDHPENVFSLQVLEGRITLKTSGDNSEVKKKEVVVLQDNIAYTIVAEKKSVFLMTLVD